MPNQLNQVQARSDCPESIQSFPVSGGLLRLEPKEISRRGAEAQRKELVLSFPEFAFLSAFASLRDEFFKVNVAKLDMP